MGESVGLPNHSREDFDFEIYLGGTTIVYGVASDGRTITSAGIMEQSGDISYEDVKDALRVDEVKEAVEFADSYEVTTDEDLARDIERVLKV